MFGLAAEPNTHADDLFSIIGPRSWEERGLCVGRWDEYDVPEGVTPNPRAARALCAGCPVIERCLLAAVYEERGQAVVHRTGIRGGTTPMERARAEALHEVSKTGVCPCGEHPFDPERVYWQRDLAYCEVSKRASAQDRLRGICSECGETRANLPEHLRYVHTEQRRVRAAS